MVCSKAWSNRHCEAPTCPPKPKAKALWRRQKDEATEDEMSEEVSSLTGLGQSRDKSIRRLLHFARNDELKFFGSIELILKNMRFTPFEKSVYKAVCAIPRGETRSYAWVAARIGRPGTARAVGNALHKNPYPVVIPCHRVVKSDGSSGGYSRGAGVKKRLLKSEGSWYNKYCDI